MSINRLPDARLTELLERNKQYISTEERATLLNDLIALYEDVAGQDPETAPQLRQVFLSGLLEMPDASFDEKYFRFFAENIEQRDFTGLRWEAPDKVISFCELLYSFQIQDETMEKRVRTHVRNLLEQALQQFEQQGNFEKLFQLLQFSPVSPSQSDTELRRLRNRAYLYEVRRVQRHRRWLFGYLVLHLFLVVMVFPWLFINAENGVIQQQIEESAQLDLPTEQQRFFSYTDGLYWSVITAASIGYGDITPMTRLGRSIAAILGVMGVITVGVIAGLILQWISPRRLD